MEFSPVGNNRLLVMAELVDVAELDAVAVAVELDMLCTSCCLAAVRFAVAVAAILTVV